MMAGDLAKSGLLAPLQVGGSSASDAAPVAAPPAQEEPGSAGGDEGGERAEDAVVPRPAPSPCTPTRAEREAHETTHLPYRNWCSVCVQGRADNPQHRQLLPSAEGERRLPEIHLDYAFLRRSGEEDLAKLLILKALPSRAVRAWIVPRKGLADSSTAERVFRGVKEMGIRAPCVVKCDGEPAVEALREDLMNRLGEGAVPQTPPVGESQSNGVVENGVKHVKGMIRAHVLALEKKLGVRIPAGHPVVAWITEAVSDLVTKHLRGQDGRTGYERLFGKAPREEGLELGEVVLWRRPKQPGMNVLLEARWEEGIWLGRRWGGITHLVGAGREVFETRAVQRRPKEERWDAARVQSLTATPWRNPTPEGTDEEVIVLPPRADAPPAPVPDRPPARDGPKQVYIRDEDLQRHGFTANCRRCMLMREGHAARGVRHTAACRTRIETAMAEANDERLRLANQRRDDAVARRLEEVDERRGADRPAEAQPPPAVVHPPAAADAPEEGRDDAVLPAVEPDGAGLCEEMQVEEEDASELMGSLLSCTFAEIRQRSMAREATILLEMLLVAGVSRGDAEAKVVELYSPPRVTRGLGTLPHLSLVGGPTFDLRSDANGIAWDFRKAEDRRRAREQIARERPFVVIGCPPCTEFSTVQVLNRHRIPADERHRRRAEALTLLGFATEIYWLQLRSGRHFVHEHPAAASSWKEDAIQALRRDPRVGEVVGDQCRYGLETKGPKGERLPARKPTRFLSSAPAI